ncbi:MAG: hypothetical protein EAZ89_01360 [Bacteroidetes bacterium]|nr:MAG: hypothetical protein EAZ89_01360 [Bacteroidota bacterium]
MDTKRTLNLTPDTPASYTPAATHLLIIGIDAYHFVGKLSNAVHDARAFAQVMQEHYQVSSVEILLDDKATREGMIEKVREMGSRLPAGHNLLIYYSGHGHFDAQMDMGYWVPADGKYNMLSSYIPYSDIRQWVIGPFKHLHHILLIADSCHAGSMFDGVRSGGGQEQFPSRWLLASGRNEVVPDGVSGSHSPFSAKLLRFLEGPHKPSFKLTELYNALTEEEAQGPRYLAAPMFVPGNQMGEFVFRKQRSEASDWADALSRDNLLVFTDFLERYPQSQHREEARQHIRRLQEIRDYQKLGKDPSLDELIGFLDKYDEDSEYRREALARKEALIQQLRDEEQTKGSQKTVQEAPKTPVKKVKKDPDPLPEPPKTPVTKTKQTPVSPLPAWIRPTSIGTGILFAIVLIINSWSTFFPGKKNPNGPQDPAQKGSVAVNYTGDPYLLSDSDFEAFSFNGKYGFKKAQALQPLNSGIVLLVPAIYDSVNSYSEGLAAAKKSGKWGYIDKGGKEVISFQYASAGSFQNGRAKVSSPGGDSRFIDKQGKPVAIVLQNPSQLKPIVTFKSKNLVNNRRLVKSNNGKFGYMDKNDKLVIPFQYSSAEDFKNGYARVEKGDSGLFFVIDVDGKCVRNCP